MVDPRLRREPSRLKRWRAAPGRPLPGWGLRAPGAQLHLLPVLAKFPAAQPLRPPQSLSSSISRRAQIRAGCIWPEEPSERPPPPGAGPALSQAERQGCQGRVSGLWAATHPPPSPLSISPHPLAPSVISGVSLLRWGARLNMSQCPVWDGRRHTPSRGTCTATRKGWHWREPSRCSRGSTHA